MLNFATRRDTGVDLNGTSQFYPGDANGSWEGMSMLGVRDVF